MPKPRAATLHLWTNPSHAHPRAAMATEYWLSCVTAASRSRWMFLRSAILASTLWVNIVPSGRPLAMLDIPPEIGVHTTNAYSFEVHRQYWQRADNIQLITES